MLETVNRLGRTNIARCSANRMRGRRRRPGPAAGVGMRRTVAWANRRREHRRAGLGRSALAPQDEGDREDLGGVTQIDTWTLIGWTVLAAVAGFAAYVLIALSLARRFTLDTGSAIEALEIELPTAGHHIALFHHAPAEKKWAEPVILCHGLGANRFNVDFVDDGLGADRISL